MQIISNKANKEGRLIVSDGEGKFDPALAELISTDKDEGLILLRYDALENGNPLGIPLFPAKAEFIVKLTPTGIHISLVISDFGDNPLYSDYENELGDIEFYVRISESEELPLVRRIAILLLNDTK